MANPDDALLPGMFVNAAWCCRRSPMWWSLPETAVDYTLYGDSVYVIREDGKDANGKPVLKAVRTPVKTGTRWDGKVAILDGRQARRAGRRRRSGQGAERRRGRDQRRSRATAAGRSAAQLSSMPSSRHSIARRAGLVMALPISSSAGRCWRWWSAC